MAYYNQNQNQDNSLGMNQKPEEDQNGTAPTALSSNAAGPTAAGPTAAPLSGNPVGQNSAPKAAASGMGGGFQGYKKANQGVATDRLNSAASKNVANQGQAAQTGINQATTQFGKKVEAGTLANRYQALSDVANTVNSARSFTAPKPAPAPLAASAEAPAAAPASPAPQAPGLADVAGVDRFKEVINAKYQGPESLRQAGLYEAASGKVGTAQDTINQTKTAAGREQMLANMYAKRGDYTRGQNKLDSAVLNSSQAGVQNLQNTAQAQGNLEQNLDKAQINSGNVAQNRTQEIRGIQEQARNAFTEGKKSEEAATDKRLNDMLVTPVMDANGKPLLKTDGTPMTQWDQLPESFKSVIKNKTADNAVAHEEDLQVVRASAPYKKAQQEMATAQAYLKNYKNKNSGGEFDGEGVARTMESNNIIKAAQEKIKGLESYNKKAINFNELESEILGVNDGEGLYRLGEKAIKTANADREKLVSKDEQSRQSILSQLAGLDNSDRLDTNLKFNNADKAGTQSVLDSLDTEATRKGLNEAEKNFQTSSNKTITGSGMKKNKTSGKKYYATDSANLKDVLKKSGYDFKGPNSGGVANADLLKSIANDSDTMVTGDPKGVGGAMDGWAGSIKNMGDGQDLGGGFLDFLGAGSGLSAVTGALGLGSLGSSVGGFLGSGSTAGESRSDAKRMARQDLIKRVQASLDKSGFDNRVGVSNNTNVTDRMSALQAMLAKLDKTNV